MAVGGVADSGRRLRLRADRSGSLRERAARIGAAVSSIPLSRPVGLLLVRVTEDGTIEGIIYSPIQVVSDYSYKQPYSFPESELVDWLITKPDGSEEGNVVGKFMDTYSSQ